MAALTHILVTAPEGKQTPVHQADGAEPGGAQLRVTSEYVRRVRYSQAIRRSIARCDLIPCDMNGTRVATVELAAAPADLAEDKIAIKKVAK